MPTYTFTRTRQQVAELVLRKLRVLGAAEAMDAEDAAVVYEALDMRLKELHELGTLWFNVAGASTSVALTGGVATATISPTDFLFPVTMRLVVGTDEQEVAIIGHAEYHGINDKTTQGEPGKVFISGSTCRFWPVPQQNYTAKLTYEAIAADTETGAAVDVPVSMIRSLVEVVAADLVDEFGVPEGKAMRLLAKQPAALRRIRMINQERADTAVVQATYY